VLSSVVVYTSYVVIDIIKGILLLVTHALIQEFIGCQLVQQMGTLINLFTSSPSIGHHLMIDLNVGNSELIL
jgi:hypothetical protein